MGNRAELLQKQVDDLQAELAQTKQALEDSEKELVEALIENLELKGIIVNIGQRIEQLAERLGV